MSQSIKCTNPFCNQNILIPPGVNYVICSACSTLHYLDTVSALDDNIQEKTSSDPQYGFGDTNNPSSISGSESNFQNSNQDPSSSSQSVPFYNPVNNNYQDIDPNPYPQQIGNLPYSSNSLDPNSIENNFPSDFDRPSLANTPDAPGNFLDSNAYIPPKTSDPDQMNFGLNPQYQGANVNYSEDSNQFEDSKSKPSNNLSFLIANNGQRFLLKEGVNIIGRKNTDIVIDHSSVSRKHCVIEAKQSQNGEWTYLIYDIGFSEGKPSTNGVYLSNRSIRLQSNEQVSIYPGITITIGNVDLTLQMK